MRKVFIVFALFILFLLPIFLFLYIYEYRSVQEQLFSDYHLTQEELNKINSGDIILRKGYGLVSATISETYNTNLDVSHCAFIIKKNNEFSVIQSVSQSLSDFDGVQSQDLKTFVKDSRKGSVIIVRYKPHPLDDVSKITKRANYYLEKKVPFDHDFDPNDSTKIYCSELLWRVFKDSYNIDIFKSEDGKIEYNYKTFDAFVDSSHFKTIINHRIKY
jgi:uncharacterized protein YycO